MVNAKFNKKKCDSKIHYRLKSRFTAQQGLYQRHFYTS